MTWLVIVYAVIVTIVQTTTAQKYQYAVSPIAGFEQFYLQVKSSRIFEKREEDEGQEIKLRVCQSIIGSVLFRTRHQCEDAVNSTSAYKFQSIVANGRKVEEKAFACTCKQRDSGNKQYHVSHEYIVETTGPRKIPGRFVFRDDTVIALAEEPATVEDTDRARVEANFWNTVYVSWHTSWNSDDVMCRLSSFQKIRLCNSVLNAPGYRDVVEFVPESKNIEPQCKRRELRFDFEQTYEKDRNNDDKIEAFKPVGPVLEWMIPCKAVLLDTREPVTRFILRGNHQHDNFRFYVAMGHEDDDLTYLESMIGDKPKTEEIQAQGQQQQQQEEEEEEEEEQGPFGSRVRGGNAEDIFSFFM